MHQGQERHAADEIGARGRQGRVPERVPQGVHRRDLSWRARRAAHAPARLQGDLRRHSIYTVERAGSCAGGEGGVGSDRRVPCELQGRADPLMRDSRAKTWEGARRAPSEIANPRLSNRARERIAGYLFVAPDAIGLLIFVGGPMILSLSLGFFSVSGFGEYAFVGFGQLSPDDGGPAVLAQPASDDLLRGRAGAAALWRWTGPRPAHSGELPLQHRRSARCCSCRRP